VQAKNKFLMLRVLKELTGKDAAFHSFGDENDALALRSRRSTQVSLIRRVYVKIYVLKFPVKS